MQPTGGAQKPLHDDEIIELAKVFYDRTSARHLLDEAGLPPELLPIQDASSERFWREVNRELTFGIVEDGRARILAAALRRYPANIVFRRWVSRLGDDSGDPSKINAPISCSSMGGHLEAFVVDDAGQLWHRWLIQDRGWSAWSNMWRPGGQVAAVAAGSHDYGHQEVAVAIGRVVHHRWWDGGWSDWHEMPALGATIKDLSFSSHSSGAWEIFAIDDAGRLHHRWWNREAGWSNWHHMAGPGNRALSAIAAGSHSPGQQELVAVADGELWHRWWIPGPGWSDWGQLGGLDMRATDVAVSSLTKGHFEIFAVSASGRLRHRWYWPDPNWSDWTDMPTPTQWNAGSAPAGTAATVAAGSHSDRHQEIFTLTTDGRVYHAWNWLKDDGLPNWKSSSEWSAWHEMPLIG
ncbi:hypothetical protein I6A60_38365 [Frankia sp. AgB1.9]|uniref:effector-associated domain EAD1-containing protein n=1 Tax=unclassified Frankia TaxID=2632575 RepID=UPI001931FA07|nr:MULTISPECIES: effector-associated domain EAD1-containing protein [unclassified Frankia]MBL7553655.1 hypothetical protein [Frankia sp. AgB1.9]